MKQDARLNELRKHIQLIKPATLSLYYGCPWQCLKPHFRFYLAGSHVLFQATQLTEYIYSGKSLLIYDSYFYLLSFNAFTFTWE